MTRHHAPGVRIAAPRGDKEALTVYRRGGVRRYTYRELEESVDKLSFFLSSRGVRRSARILILLSEDDKELQVFLMLALLRLGAQFGFLFSRLPRGVIDGHLKRARPDFVIADTRIFSGRLACPAAVVTRAELQLSRRGACRVRAGLGATDRHGGPRVLVSTSGTTASPKMVMTGHAGYFRSLDSFERDLLNLDSSSVFLIGLLAPFGPTVGLYSAAFSIGCRVVICEERDYLRNGRFAHIAMRERVDACAFVPAFLDAMRHPVRRPLRLAFTGDRITPAQWAACCRLFPRARVLNIYGLAETMVCCASRSLQAQPANARRINQLFPVPGVSYVLKGRDRQGIGELWIRGPSGLCRGYLGAPAAFRSRFDPAGRYFNTRDVARRGSAGAVEIVGRSDTLSKVKCRYVEPAVIEEACRLVNGVEKAKAVCRDGVVSLFVQGRADAAAMTRSIVERVGAYAVPARVVFVGSMPVGATGKIDEKRLWERTNDS